MYMEINISCPFASVKLFQTQPHLMQEKPQHLSHESVMGCVQDVTAQGTFFPSFP